ncbi:UDP-galactose transporter [Suillus fuscotomentosus]|uniref:UDP-galactose transporter homolog 1 n=1 Tax=Suillus fuscotomentosus TaxID=1912939 RepID=A0AAD4E2J2_9AGAM|nr:UDP-galactose transporter [Suillus fuscotomentosus]KAG1898157.1 UDP-galactose transporter [Suillus fuscotomentosus]
MSVLRLGLCVLGVYSMFLLWAVAQERLSVPFQHIDGQSTDKFKSALFLGTCQSFLSSLSALAYILIRGKSGSSLSSLLGLDLASMVQTNNSSHSKTNGSSSTKVNGHSHSSSAHLHTYSSTSKALLLRYLQVSAFITLAAPFGFAALSYITYPTMVLGKSCKLVPVMLMNFVMYRRRFAPHKYIVVAMVTAGISVFMGFGNEKPSKASSNGEQGSHSQLIGILYLFINLILDGAVNSTQDEMFARYKVTGQQMMFWINIFCTLLTTALGTLPLPHIPVLHPSSGLQSEFANAIGFIRTHPSAIIPLVQFSLTGALGQLFIFETLQHFGSLTLVMITLTRKMFTMILSVVVYDHRLTLGQWAGAAIVFWGISVEAWVKRKEVHAKRVLQEKEKAKIKSL